MTIPIACPECGQKYQLKDELAGKKVRCRSCEAVIAVPKPVAPAAKPKNEYPEVDFEDYAEDDDELDFDELAREERSSHVPLKKRTAISHKTERKNRTLYSEAALDPSWITIYGVLGGAFFILNIILQNVFIAFKNPLHELVELIVYAFTIGLLFAFLLRLSIKIVTGMSLKFYDAYLLNITCSIFSGSIAKFLFLVSVISRMILNWHEGIFVTAMLLSAIGTNSYVLGSCLLDEDDQPVGTLKGLMICLTQFFSFLCLIFCLGLLFAIFRHAFFVNFRN